jgi:hypothetical protein
MPDPLRLLADDLGRQQAAPYRKAADTLHRHADRLPADDPERARLRRLARAASGHADRLEGRT